MVKPYFKNVLNSIELPLISFFYTTHSFLKKLKTLKLREKKSFVNNGTFFFQNSKLCSGMVPSINRSSHRRCSIRKGVLRNFIKFTGNHLCQSLFFNEVAGLGWVFSCEFCKISLNTFLTQHFWVTASDKDFLN